MKLALLSLPARPEPIRRHALAKALRSSSPPPQPMMMALTTSSLGRASPFMAAYIVECTTAWPARFAILRHDGSPDQNLYCRRASMNSAGVVAWSGSGLRSNPAASLICWPIAVPTVATVER